MNDKDIGGCNVEENINRISNEVYQIFFISMYCMEINYKTVKDLYKKEQHN